MGFSSHNVLLPDGTQTAPDRPLVARSGACQAALGYLQEEFGPGPHPGVSVADLGCLEGGYAAEFARAGYDVTGVEVRQENYESALWLQAALGLPNLRFVQGDARDVLPGKSFDVVFCCGLLYHLEHPVAFLNLVAQATRRMLILNTHFSAENGHPEHAHLPTKSYCDTQMAYNEGRAGHWFHEEDDRWASVGGASSFWLRLDELLLTLREAGFAETHQRFDWLTIPNLAGLPWGSGGVFPDRGMFVALK